MPVVILLTLVATVAFMLNHESALDNGITASILEGRQAEYVALAGLNHALWQRSQQGCGPYTDLNNQALDNHSYTTTLTTDLGGTTAYTVNVDQDTWIRNDQPTTNKAYDAKLHIRNESGVIERPMYRYDLSSIAENSNILSATAWFYVSKEHPQGPVDIHLLNADWTEADATWDSMGANMDAVVLIAIPTQAAAGVWVAVNFTAQVQAWVNGQPNYGITLNSTSEGTHGDYASREAGQQPFLEVIVGTPPSSPAILQSVGTLNSGISRTLVRDDADLYQYPPNHVELRPGSEGRDASLDDSHQSFNYGADDELWVQSSGASNDRHSLIRFDLAHIPYGASITSATLELYQNWAATPGGAVSVNRVIRDWVEGTDNGSPGNGATWNKADQTTNWSTSGGDFDIMTVSSTTITAATTGYYDWDLTALVQGWVSGSYPNLGLILTGETIGTNAVFRSSDHTIEAERPRLTITFSCRCGQACLAPRGFGNILFVVSNASAMTNGEQAKKALFESWGYAVDLISQWNVSSDFDNRMVSNDVVYVSEAVLSIAPGLASTLAATSYGVIYEEGTFNNDFGVASGQAWPVGHTVNVTDNSHYITRLFATGNLQIFSRAMQGLSVSGSEAGGLLTLADWGSGAGLAILETGAALEGGGTAPGRRVMLPLGRDHLFKPVYLNNQGRLIVQRAIQWGSGLTAGPASTLIISTDNAAELGGLSFQNSDLVEYRQLTDSASFFLDSAAAGLTGNVDAVHVLANGHILLSTKNDTSFAGLSFKKQDLVVYDPVAGAATMYLEAEAHFDIKKNIISVHVLGNGNIVFSTDGDATIGGVSFSEKDLVEYNRLTGNASIFFDGDATSLSNKISGVHVLQNGHIVLTADGNTTLGGLNFSRDQLIEYDPLTDTATMYFDGETKFSTSGEKIRSVHLGAGSGQAISSTVPLAHWELNEPGGTSALDSVGGHNGTLLNGPAWASGQLDGALNFDGSNDHINVPHDDALSLTETMTLTAWVNAASFGSGYQTILAKDSGGSGSNFWFGAWQDELLFGFFASGSFRAVVTTGLGLQAGNWYHLAASFDNATGQVRLSVDGAEVHNEILAFSPSAVSADVTIGRSSNGEYWPGLLDDVRIYDVVLADTEITSLVTAGGGGGDPNPGPCDGTFRDELINANWSGSNGTLDWSTSPWAEVGESDGADAGDVLVTNDLGDSRLRIRDNQNGGEGVERVADLSGATSATLSLEYRRDALDNADDYAAVFVSMNGTAGPWTEIVRFQGGDNDASFQPFSQDISAHISAQTAIRLLSSPNLGNNDIIWFDNIQIQCSP